MESRQTFILSGYKVSYLFLMHHIVHARSHSKNQLSYFWRRLNVSVIYRGTYSKSVSICFNIHIRMCT